MRFACRSTASLAVITVLIGVFHASPSWSQQAGQTDDTQQTPTQPAQPAQPSTGLHSWSAFPTTNLFSAPALQRPGLTPAAELPPPYLAKFSVEGKESWTDNAFLTSSATKSDSITTINPTVDLSATSRKLNAGLNYDGGYDRYLSNTKLDGFRHNAIGLLNGELVDQQLFLDSRGSISEQNVNPSAATTSGSRTSPESQVRIFTYDVGPRLQERLGNWAVGQLTATHGRTVNENLSSSSSNATQTATSSLGGTTTDHGRLELRNGQSFTQMLWDYSSDFTQTNQNTGTLDQTTHQLGAEYRLNQNWGLLASGGHDTIHGIQVSSSNSGFFYNGGLHWTPSPNMDLRGGVGRRYGQTNYSGLLNYKIGPSTSLRASHDVGITTDSLNLFDSLNAVQRDDQGNFVDPFSGLTANPASSPFQRSGAVYRKETTEVAVTHSGSRDSVSLSGDLAKQTIISGSQTAVSSLTGAPLSNVTNTLSAAINWTHQVTPALSTIATLSGNDVISASLASSKTKSASASLGLNYLLNPTLTAELNYKFTDTRQPASSSSLNTNPLQTGTIVEDVAYIGLKKQF
jgi:uncharacterized protein (PEP-CTERM system associated)